MMIGTLDRAAQLAADREAVGVGQAEVEQHEVGLGRLERPRPVADALDGEALAPQALGERLGDRVLVLDEQELHRSECLHDSHEVASGECRSPPLPAAGRVPSR